MSDLIDRTNLLEQLKSMGRTTDNRGRYIDMPMLYEIIDLVESQIIVDVDERYTPKIPYLWGDGYSDGEPVVDMWECPNCGEDYELECQVYKHCPNCGQAIDWEVEA